MGIQSFDRINCQPKPTIEAKILTPEIVLLVRDENDVGVTVWHGAKAIAWGNVRTSICCMRQMRCPARLYLSGGKERFDM